MAEPERERDATDEDDHDDPKTEPVDDPGGGPWAKTSSGDAESITDD